MRDLVVLTADRDIEQTVIALLGRPEALGIRQITFDVVPHPQHDPGCFSSSAGLLEGYADTHRHALVVFDRAWDGAPTQDPRELEHKVETDLEVRWAGRAATVVIDPEVEVWVFSDSPHVEATLGWTGRTPRLRAWLTNLGLWDEDLPKPSDPKTAFERALREARRPNSSAIFRELANKVSVQRCSDPSFRRLRGLLTRWFAVSSEGTPPP